MTYGQSEKILRLNAMAGALFKIICLSVIALFLLLFAGMIAILTITGRATLVTIAFSVFPLLAILFLGWKIKVNLAIFRGARSGDKTSIIIGNLD